MYNCGSLARLNFWFVHQENVLFIIEITTTASNIII